MPQSSTNWRTLSIAALVMLIAILPYLNALAGDFTFDDLDVIRDNPVVQQEPIGGLATDVHYPGALYRPFTMLTYAINARMGNQPLAFHAFNIACHALVSAAGYLLAFLILRSHAAAIVAAVLFAVHPCHTEAVTSIVGRAELLAALFVVLSLLSLSRQLQATGVRRGLWECAALATLAIAWLAKESAFTGIALVAVLHHHWNPDAALRQRVRILAPYALLGAAYLALRVLVVGSLALPTPPGSLDNPLAHVSPLVRISTALVVLSDYVAVLAMPIELAADYSFNQVPLVLSLTDPRFLMAITLFVALGALLAWNARRIGGLGTSVALAVIPLALTANVLFPIGTIKAERLLYLPSLGVCVAAAALLTQKSLRARPMHQALLLMFVAAFALRTWERNNDWRDNLALFEATVASSPNSAKAHHNVAVFLQRTGRLDDALEHYHRAADIYPEYAEAIYGIGRIHELRGNLDAALYWYDAALQQDWHLAKAHLQIGMIYNRMKAFTAAEVAFRSGLQVDPLNPLLLVNLSALQLAQGDRWRAQALLNQLDLAAVSPDTIEVVAAARHEIAEAIE